MAGHRIDPSRIKTNNTKPRAKGGQGVVIVATLLPAAGAATPEPEKMVAVKKLEWKSEDAERSIKFFKVLFCAPYLLSAILIAVQQSFVNELSLMARLSHPNIIKLLGFVEDTQKRDAWIVLPWEGNGNVREFLQSGKWDVPERVSLVSARRVYVYWGF